MELGHFDKHSSTTQERKAPQAKSLPFFRPETLNFTHRWPQSGHFFPQISALFSNFWKRAEETSSYSLPLVTRLHKTYGHHTLQTGELRWGATTSKVTWPCNHVATWSHTTNKSNMSPLPRRMWLLNLEWQRFIIKDHRPSGLLTLWALDRVITWLTKNVIFLLPWELWLRVLTEWWVLMWDFYPKSHITCWSSGHKSYNKWKTFLIHFYVTCGFQSWQKGSLWVGVTGLTTKSHIPLTMRLSEVTWQMNFIIYLFYEAYCH